MTRFRLGGFGEGYEREKTAGRLRARFGTPFTREGIMRSWGLPVILLLILLVSFLPPLFAQDTPQACAPAEAPSAVAAPSGGAYRGPLFDTHLHLTVIRRFGSASGLCAWLERRQVLWAIGFVSVPPAGPSGTLTPLLSSARPRVVFLLRPLSSGGFVDFARGRYSEDLLRQYVSPLSAFRGLGEISLHQPGMEAIGFNSPPMHTLYRILNEMQGVLMIHPRGDGTARGGGPVHTPSEIEPVIQQYPNITFLFHGGPSIFDPFVAPLMARYANVYFTFDATLWLFSVPLGQRNALGHMDPAASAETFFSRVSSAGGLDQIVELAFQAALPRLRRFPDRVMWGTDLLLAWHFEEDVAGAVGLASRRFINRLPAELQEPYAFRNALRVFSPHLIPTR